MKKIYVLAFLILIINNVFSQCNPVSISITSAQTICAGECVDISASALELEILPNQSGSWGSTYTMAISNTFIDYFNPYIDSVQVSDATRLFYSVGLESLTYSDLSELVVKLVCPGGDTIILLQNTGVAGEQLGGDPADWTQETLFALDAIDPISSGSGYYNGSFVPSGGSLISVTNCDPNGYWKLIVEDPIPGGSGYINDWFIQLRYINEKPISNYYWSPITNMTNEQTNTPTVCPADTTEYWFVASESNGCKDSLSVVVNVLQQSGAGDSTTIVVYTNDGKINLFDSIPGNPNRGGLWVDKFISGALIGDSLDVAQLSANSSYEYLYITSNASCGDTSLITVNVLEFVVAPANCNIVNINVSTDEKICAGDCIDLAASATELEILPNQSGSWASTYSMAISNTFIDYFNPYIDSVQINDATRLFYSVALESLTYSNLSELIVKLVCPGGDTIVLMQNTGVAGEQLGGDPADWTQETLFALDATDPISSGSGYYNGSFVPSGGSLINMTNCDPNGYWKLIVEDPIPGGSGFINDWYIQLRYINKKPISNYYWLPITNMTNEQTNSPTVCPADTTEYWFVISDSNGCKDSLSVSVNAIEQLTAGDTTSIVVYTNDLINLFDSLQGNPDTVGYWIDKVSTGALVGDILFASQLLAGVSYEFLYIAGFGNCLDTSMISVYVEEVVLDTCLIHSLFDTICVTQNYYDLEVLLDTLYSTDGYWNIVVDSDSMLIDQAGLSEVIYMKDRSTCTDTVSIKLLVMEVPQFFYTIADFDCEGLTLGFELDSVKNVFAVDYTLFLGNGDSLRSTQIGQQINYNYADTGSYDLVIAYSGICSLKDTISIHAQPISFPTAGVDIIDESCSGYENGTISIINQTGNVPFTYLWSNGATLSSISGLAPGEYTYTVTDSNNCFITDTVAVDNGLVMEIDIAASVYQGETPLLVEFQMNSMADSLTWNIANLSSSTEFNTSYEFTEEGEYTISAISYNNSCSSKDSLVIAVELPIAPFEYKIPAVFTPNGDGVNDWFGAFGSGFNLNTGIIFNRWGASIFSWENVQYGWDGRTFAGSEAPEGTYYYVINIESDQGDIIEEKGTITLLR